MTTTAIFPGTFDPLTNGHLDIALRASKIFDQVIIAVGVNDTKKPIFTEERRVQLIEENIQQLSNVSVMSFRGLTVDFAKKNNATHLVRGVRSAKDYEYERDIAEINYQLTKIDTVLLYARPEFQNISSTLLKAVAIGEYDLSSIVPNNVANAMKELRSNK